MSDTPETAILIAAIVPPETAGGTVDWTSLPAGTYLHARRLDPARSFRDYMPLGENAIYLIGADSVMHEVTDIDAYGKPNNPFYVPARIWDPELKTFISSWEVRLATKSEVTLANILRHNNWLNAIDAAQIALAQARTTCMREMDALGMLVK